MTRLPNWPDLLAAFLDRAQDESTPEGEGDIICALSSMAAVEAICGAHPCPWLATRLRESRDPAAVLAELGGFAEAVTGVLGEPLDSWKFAHRGDVALFTHSGTERLGIVNGDVIVCKSPSGMTQVRLGRATAAWAVGR